jgi:myosin heavy subunit
MAEARFIKTVTFGGYDKAEVIRRLEYLNNQVFDLKNELRETKLLMEAYKKGTEAEKAHETVMAGERAKLTQVQVQNETLSTKLKAVEEENRVCNDKITELTGTVTGLEDQLKKAKESIAAMKAGTDAASLSQVFIEAQKSADMLISNAKNEAANIEAEAKRLAESTVADANDEAKQIIYDAEREAAVKLADVKNTAEELKTSNNNLKAVMLDDVTRIGAQMSQLRTVLEKFVDNGLADISDAEERLFNVSNTLREGGVPVFREPERLDLDLPEPPKREALRAREEENAAREEEKQKQKEGLDKLKQMAEALEKLEKTGDKPADAKEEAAPEEIAAAPEEEKPAGKKGGKIDLAALAAQASALGDK